MWTFTSCARAIEQARNNTRVSAQRIRGVRYALDETSGNGLHHTRGVRSGPYGNLVLSEYYHKRAYATSRANLPMFRDRYFQCCSFRLDDDEIKQVIRST